MLQAHSFLWHYLWLGPQVLQLVLALFIWRRNLHKAFPIFFTYLVLEAVEEFILYGMDVGSASDSHFWQAYCAGRVVEGFLKIAVIGELFRHLVIRWPALAKFGNRLISGLAALLVVVAVSAAAHAPLDNRGFVIISRAHIIEQTFYIVQSGLVLFLFLFASHFHLSWGRGAFGIALGFALLVCEHLAAWATTVSGALIDKRELLDFLNMATYHLCVLIWAYYLLVPRKRATTSAVSLPENNLSVWNRELERLLRP